MMPVETQVIGPERINGNEYDEFRLGLWSGLWRGRLRGSDASIRRRFVFAADDAEEKAEYERQAKA